MNENEVRFELLTYFDSIFKRFPQLNLSVVMEMNFSFISNRPEEYKTFTFDIIVQKNERPFIIIEIKSKSFLEEVANNTLISIASPGLEITTAKYFIFTDGLVFKLVDSSKAYNVEQIDKDRISILFSRTPEIESINQNKQYLFEIITNGLFELGINEKWYSLFSGRTPDDIIEYDNGNDIYTFKGDPNNFDSFENRFFQSLLPEYTDKTIFRYTTVSSVESMLRYNTFRMNGIVGMNDTTEIDYVDFLVFNGRRPLDEWLPHEVEEVNKVFVTSCSSIEKEDDLTLWRLYGDDSKGISLKLSVEHTNIKNNMIVAKVSYGKKDRSHPQIDLIKKLAVEFKQVRSARFEFKTYHIWKHFFKPYQYEVEQEVRLLYILNEESKPKNYDWVVTYGDRIFNPFVDFNLNSPDFPLKLQEIILGPNTPSKNVNKAQLEEYIRQLNLKNSSDKEGRVLDKSEYSISDLFVKISSIDNYRKS